MHKLHELKNLLCKELEEYGDKNKLDVGALEIVDKLAHAIKNIDRVIEYNYLNDDASYEYRGRDTYSEGYGNMDDAIYAMNTNSYARGRGRGRGRNAKRDSMGRYSRAEDDVIEDLKEVLNNVRDGQTRKEIERIVDHLENM